MRISVLDKGGTIGPLIRTTVAAWSIHNVQVFASRRHAMISIATRPPDILIIDWIDDLCDAVWFARTIRNREVFPHPFLALIIAMSDVTRERVLMARDAGADEILARPFSPKALYERITSIVDNRRGFVDVPGYFGPDRRRGAIAAALGVERRSGISILIDPNTRRKYVEAF